MAVLEITHKFVDLIPDELEPEVLYVSLDYATVAHLCFCGCGQEVVTPLSPTDWKLTFDGVSISLSPSIGNWSFPCRSHYWIRSGKIRWAESWSDEKIAGGRGMDKVEKDNFFGSGVESPMDREEFAVRWPRLHGRANILYWVLGSVSSWSPDVQAENKIKQAISTHLY